MTTFFKSLDTRIRFFVLLFADVFATLLSFYLAFILKGPLSQASELWFSNFTLILVAIGIRLVVFKYCGLYLVLWRYASIKELYRLFKAEMISLGIVLVILFFRNKTMLYNSLLIIELMINAILIGGSRLLIRYIKDYLIPEMVSNEVQDKKRLLIIGAGDAGEMIVRELRRVNSLQYDVVGFLDDNPNLLDREIHGSVVLGKVTQFVDVCKKHKVNEAIIAIPSASGKEIRQIIQKCEFVDVKLKITPGLYEIIDGKVTVNEVRDIELKDLLGRKPVDVDLSSISQYVQGETVLITGAGGSIGSELSKQLLRFGPKQLILLDHSEQNLYFVDQLISSLSNESTESNEKTEFSSYVADIKDFNRLESIFSHLKPSIVFHAAAYKHVPLMQDPLNVSELILNNVLGTQNIIQLSKKYQSKKCVFISTDKAVDPSNCMGASKRLCEFLILAESNSETQFSAVRFGNVLGSVGSVVPLFKEQIKKGGPVTVTNVEMTRYFMTKEEAVQLVIQAGAFCSGGEIFVLDMGEPVKIINLAKNMIRLSGYQEGKDIEIKFIGDRSGEKLHEHLFYDYEKLLETFHQKISVVSPYVVPNDIYSSIQSLLNSCSIAGDSTMIKDSLMTIVESYSYELV